MKVSKQSTTYELNVKPYLGDISKWREEGLNMTQVAKKLGIAVQLFARFVREKDALYLAWYSGEVLLTEEMENVAYKEASGYYMTEVATETVYNTDGEIIGKKIKKTKKWHRPQANILRDVLKALHPAKWREQEDKQVKEVEIVMPDELEKLAE